MGLQIPKGKFRDQAFSIVTIVPGKTGSQTVISLAVVVVVVVLLLLLLVLLHFFVIGDEKS